MKKDARGFVIELNKKVIPHNDKSDPSFTYLGCEPWYEAHALEIVPSSILEQFTPEEVVYMVNRFLYQAEYSRTVHRDRARAEADLQKPLKARVEAIFGIKWTKATAEQLAEAAASLRKETLK